MKKRILLVLTVLTMLLCVPLVANAASVDDLTFDPTTGTITDCNEEAEGELAIPEEIDGVRVTSIGKAAFRLCMNLTSVNIPEGVISIGNFAFDTCENLTSVNIPDSVTSIDYGAFESCTNLPNINIPEGVTSIADYAFDFCESLTSVNIPDSVTSIGEWAFYGCKSLPSVNIPDSVTNIGEYAFAECAGLTSIDIPNGVTSIGSSAFSDCTSLPSINIPDSVTSIGSYAFHDCDSLISINIPDSVTSIGEYAFNGTGYYKNADNWEYDVLYIGDYLIGADVNDEYDIKDGTRVIAGRAFYGCRDLTTVNIPGSVINIGYSTFVFCGNLNINVSPNNQNYCDIDGVLFTKDKKTIVAYAKDKLQPDYIIPDGVTSIGNNAFSDCSSLTTVNIPDSVTSISDYAFSDCTSLPTVNIPDSVTSISDYAFSDCTSLPSIDIPNGVTSIGKYAFAECTGLTSVTIPNSVTSIGNDAFRGCDSLPNINIPDSVTSIGNRAFCCYNLNINVSPNNQNYCDIDGVLFTKDKKTIVAYAKSKLQPDYIIPNGVTSIGDYAFWGYSYLTSVGIPDSVTDIDVGAFFHCNGLTDIYYSGTEEQWKQINGSETILNVTIHYNSEMPVKILEVQPVEPIIDVEAHKIEIPVTVVDEAHAAKLNEVELYVAEYDENGCLTGLTLGTKSAVEGDTITITADIPDAENYKFMLWDGNNAPLMDAITSISE